MKKGPGRYAGEGERGTNRGKERLSLEMGVEERNNMRKKEKGR